MMLCQLALFARQPYDFPDKAGPALEGRFGGSRTWLQSLAESLQGLRQQEEQNRC